MEQNSEEESAQAVGPNLGFEYLTDDMSIYSGIPRYRCLTCGVGVAIDVHVLHSNYHKKRGDYHD